MVENAEDIEVKANLQPPSETKEINFRYPRSYRLLAKKNKDNVNWEHWNKVKDKAKSHNLSFANS